MPIQILGPSPDDRVATQKAVKDVIDEFDVFFKSLGNDEGLIRAERALLQTFLLAHLSGRVQVPLAPADLQTSEDAKLDALLGGSTSPGR